MVLGRGAREEVAELALRLLRLEEEVAAFRELHEQELRPLERRLQELRAALARIVEVKRSE